MGRHRKDTFYVNADTDIIPAEYKKVVINKKVKVCPDFPYSVEEIECLDNKHITTLTELPPNLRILDWRHSNLTSLSDLPESLERLIVIYNKLTELPLLPDNLQLLRCAHNLLTEIPPLPDTLIELNCSHNSLTELPTLPRYLRWLYCQNNNITKLPLLPFYTNATSDFGDVIHIQLEQYNTKAREMGLPTRTSLTSAEEYNSVVFHDTGKQVSRMVDVGNVLLSAGLPPLVVAEIVDKENPSVSAFYVEQINGLMESLNQQRNSIIRSRTSRHNNNEDDDGDEITIPISRYKMKTKAHTNIKSARGVLPETSFK
uniref:Leucine-rich repeat-containing protein n=1 Tax=viral metagenome TaxID=1070528 RepID=A0A6C0JXR1_9ZZZZ